MKRFKPGRSEVSFLCAVAMLTSVTTFVISSEASAKPRFERTGEEIKARGKSKKFAQNSAPTLSGSPGATVLENSFYDFLPDASDPNGDPLTFSIVNQPHWADFDPTTGALYGTPTSADVGRYAAISIAVSDGQASTSLPDFTIDVTSNAVGSVTLSWQPPTENTDGTPLTDLAGYRIYYSADPQDLKNVIEITNASVTTYLVDNLTPNIWYFAATSLNSSDVESSRSSPVSYVVD